MTRQCNTKCPTEPHVLLFFFILHLSSFIHTSFVDASSCYRIVGMLTWQGHAPAHETTTTGASFTSSSHSFFTFGLPFAFPHAFERFSFASTTRRRKAFRKFILQVRDLFHFPLCLHYLFVISPCLCLSSRRNCASEDSLHKFAFPREDIVVSTGS